MALNKLMHPRNPYKNKRPDFKALAVKYEEFRTHATQDVKGNVHLDFKKPECLRALSWALLKEDFGVDVNMPLDRLIPTIPLRLNYILWLEDLLETVSSPRGIDIGTGASCIYPIIGAKKNSWKFLASEADKMNYAYASKNVRDNNLQNSIEVRQVEEDVMLADMLMDGDGQFDFCMTNPPFYGSNMEAWGMLTAPRKEERPEPNSVCTASPAESITPGGEVAFVKRLITDSLVLKDRVRVYTTMLGKKTSIFPLKEELKRNGITNVGQTEFCQGRTMRWGLAWSFDSSIQFPKPASKQLKSVKKKPPLVHKMAKELTTVKHDVLDIGSRIMAVMDELKILYEPENSSPEKLELELIAMENTWSHQRQKRRAGRKKTKQCDSNNGAANVDSLSEVTQSQKDNVERPENDEKSENNSSKDNDHIGQESSATGRTLPCKRNSDGDTNDDVKKFKVDESGANTSVIKFAEVSFDDAENYLLKAHLKLHKDADDILLEMKWIDGENNESMHQVMQYFKNNVK